VENPVSIGSKGDFWGEIPLISHTFPHFPQVFPQPGGLWNKKLWRYFGLHNEFRQCLTKFLLFPLLYFSQHPICGCKKRDLTKKYFLFLSPPLWKSRRRFEKIGKFFEKGVDFIAKRRYNAYLYENLWEQEV